MPNRKDIKSTKNSQQRIKGRSKKEKAVLKTANVLKVRVPRKKTSISNAENLQASQEKISINDIKIMLANEVIRAQFPDKFSLIPEPPQTVLHEKPIKKNIVKRPTLKRNYRLRKNNQDSENKIEEELIDGESVRRTGRKVMTKQMETKAADDKSAEAPKDATPKPVKKQPSRPAQLRRRRAAKETESANVNAKNEEQPTKPKAIKSVSPAKYKPGPRTRKRARDAIGEEPIKVEPEGDEKQDKDVLEVKDFSTSRRNSNLSELSWTKDISSSSTTTCVTVSTHDFVRIDKKIPFIKLTNIDCNVNTVNGDTCVNDSEQCADNICKLQEKCEEDRNISCRSLNLSTSSCDTCSSPRLPLVINKITEALNKLSNKLKNFDLEVINWIGCSNENRINDRDILDDKIFDGDFLKEERDVIVTCKEIKRILLSKNSKEMEVEDASVVDEAKIKNNVDKTNLPKTVDEEKIQNAEDNTRQNIAITKEAVNGDFDKCMENNKQNVKYTSFDDNDDDDTLSLFAESITGFDSSKRTTKTGSHEFEEYVPKPIHKNNLKSPEMTYQPTLINNKNRSDEDNVVSNVCEKQNADSTSVYRDDFTRDDFVYTDGNIDFTKDVTFDNHLTSPRFMASIQKPIQAVKSVVFRGVCFFYLISSCKKTICKFPHTFIKIEDIKKRLLFLSEDMFIQEYMLMRNWPQLRRIYGKCFVDECVKRELPRILVEMSIDFIVKANSNSREDNSLKIDVVESTLLCLNHVDLKSCSDLLTYQVQAFTGVMLCDFFMTTIAESQNFSRFKLVFINLADFMCCMGRTFDIEVATHFLERVSILPYDEGLALALMKILKNTDAVIFSNSMIGKFETRLITSNVELHNELLSMKEKSRNSRNAFGGYNKIPPEGASKMNNNLTNKDIRYSPDTTNLDVNKTAPEPIITRTIDLKKLKLHLTPNSTSEGRPSNIHSKWTNKTIFHKIGFQRSNQAMMPPQWPSKRRSDQNIEARFSKFQRRNISKFTQDF